MRVAAYVVNDLFFSALGFWLGLLTYERRKGVKR